MPNVRWEDIGGLEDAKSAILDTVGSLGAVRLAQPCAHGRHVLMAATMLAQPCAHGERNHGHTLAALVEAQARRLSISAHRRTAHSLTPGSSLRPSFPAQAMRPRTALHPLLPFLRTQIELPLKHPHLFARGLATRSGLLLYGPPGGRVQWGQRVRL